MQTMKTRWATYLCCAAVLGALVIVAGPWYPRAGAQADQHVSAIRRGPFVAEAAADNEGLDRDCPGSGSRGQSGRTASTRGITYSFSPAHGRRIPKGTTRRRKAPGRSHRRRSSKSIRRETSSTAGGTRR